MIKKKLNLKSLSVQSFITQSDQVKGGSRAGCVFLTAQFECQTGGGGTGGGGTGGGGTGGQNSADCPPNTNTCPTHTCESDGVNQCLTVQAECTEPTFC